MTSCLGTECHGTSSTKLREKNTPNSNGAQAYRHGHPPATLKGRVVVLVDEAAALSTTVLGARASLPWRADVDRLAAFSPVGL